MKTLHIPTTLTAEQASGLSQFINELQESIWVTYGKEITSACVDEYAQNGAPNGTDEAVPFDDDMPF